MELGDRYKIVSTDDILASYGRTDLLPISINKDYYKKLKMNLLVPSNNQSYSCAIEYMSHWFYSKFGDKFFKSRYLEASHILDQLRKLRNKDLMTVTKPAAVISADLDMSFNRENLDLYNLGRSLYNNRTSYKDAFFQDREKNLFISMNMEMLLFNFNFKMKFPTKALQIDVAKMCQLAFRSNGTQKHYNDVDYHIPEELILQLAEDTGHYIRNDKICDVVKFLHYANNHSTLGFFYKLNTSTGNMEYFIKIPKCIVHIRTSEVTVDGGARYGMLTNDFIVNFDCTVRFPTPKFYAYYSFTERESIKCISRLDAKSFMISVTNLSKIPSIDEHGWHWDIQTKYVFRSEEEIQKIKDKELMAIEFSKLIADLKDVVEYTRSIAIAPEVFLNIQIYNNYSCVPIKIDWQTYTIHLLQPIESQVCHIIVYMDKDYIHTQIANIEKYNENRIQPSDTMIERRTIEPKKKPKKV